ncbi:MAG: ornithine carbamoyltransferase [Leptospiraceae bacterium]|nr:ornithine carbamoyltransferase [Leptospiraceae bacterium]MDW8305829.1 ornithine carbamoyltransferase [Leptospiraceae bacterium]
MPRHFLSISDISRQEFHSIIDFALAIKRNPLLAGRPLENRHFALIFEKPSTRTRVSFEVAIHQLGGHTLFLSGQELQLSRGESPEDTAAVLSRYVDGIVIRTFSHEKLISFAQASQVSVINGLSDSFHPCQALADFLTIKENRRTFSGLKIVFLGDGSSNVCNSLIMAAAYAGAHVTVACPDELSPPQAILEFAKAEKMHVELERDAERAAAGADVLYTDVWVSMGQENQSHKKKQLLEPYQLNERVQAKARKDHLVMHCLPAHKGEEITQTVFESVNSVIFDQAENRLHAQKSLLHFLYR